MEKYENEKFLINTIMGQSRHQFIYGYENEMRDNFIKKLITSYPIEIDSDKPMAIYVNDFGLPHIKSESIDKNKTDIISNEYLAFTIASNILNRSKEIIDINTLNERLVKLLSLTNKFRNSNYPEIKNLDDLIIAFKDSQEFYYNNYLNAIKTGSYNIQIDKITIPFLEIGMFITDYKRVINNNSYFALIFDNKDDICLSSYKSINLLVGSRINKDISVKVFTEPNKWKIYFDLNDNYVQAIHDYEGIELDDIYRRIKRK